MIKDFFISFKENLYVKASNPFYGTLLVVFVFNNWTLIYSVFNFDSNLTLEHKLDYINKYIINNPTYESILWSILETIIIIIVGYFFANIVRLIVNLYDKQLTPIIYKISDSKSIILKSEYDILLNERIRLENRLDEERAQKTKLQTDYERLETKISSLIKQNAELNSIIQTTTPPNEENISNNENELNLIAELFERENLIDDFMAIGSNIKNKISMDKKLNTVTQFTTLGLIEVGSIYPNGQYAYSFTDLGAKLHKKIQLQQIQLKK